MHHVHFTVLSCLEFADSSPFSKQEVVYSLDVLVAVTEG